MAATPYTIELFSLDNAVGPMPILAPVPPQGTTWIVRDVIFYYPTTSNALGAVAQATLAIDGIIIAATPAFRSVANTSYRVGDVRQAYAGVQTLSFNSAAGGWQLLVTGYAFS